MAISQRWKLSAAAYFADFVFTPLWAAAALWLSPWSLSWCLLGALLWSLLEYGLHRFSFHRQLRRAHWTHHAAPRDYIGVSGWWVSLLLAALLGLALATDLAALFAGFALAYQAYLLAHYLMHRPESRWHPLVRGLARNHDLHHRHGVEKNFGVTSPLWDHLLGTYFPPAAMLFETGRTR